MKCEGHPELLQQYIDNELNEVETLLFENHLRNCSSCRCELNQLILVDWQLHRLNQHIEIPIAELSIRREAALAEFFKAEDAGDINDLYRVQISAMKKSVEFMQYLPGAKLSRKLGNAGKDYLNNDSNPPYSLELGGDETALRNTACSPDYNSSGLAPAATAHSVPAAGTFEGRLPAGFGCRMRFFISHGRRY